MLHTVSVYGVVGDRESNSALWDDVLHHLSGLGNAPHIVGADRNFPLGGCGMCCWGCSPTCSRAGWWI